VLSEQRFMMGVATCGSFRPVRLCKLWLYRETMRSSTSHRSSLRKTYQFYRSEPLQSQLERSGFAFVFIRTIHLKRSVY
jgi:hypothetical protein